MHIDIHHDLGTGGDPTFAGAFHGAGSGGAEPVDPHTTGLAKLGGYAECACAG